MTKFFNLEKWRGQKIWLWPYRAMDAQRRTAYEDKIIQNLVKLKDLQHDLENLPATVIAVLRIESLTSISNNSPKGVIIISTPNDPDNDPNVSIETRVFVKVYRNFSKFRIKIFINNFLFQPQGESTHQEINIDSNTPPEKIVENLIKWQKEQLDLSMGKIRCPWLLDDGKCSLNIPELENKKCPWFTPGVITNKDIGTARTVAVLCQNKIRNTSLISQEDKQILIDSIKMQFQKLKSGTV